MDIRNYFGSKGGGKKAVKKDETAKKPLEEVVDLDGGGDDDDFAVSRSGKARAVSESATKRQSRTRGASKEAQKMVAAATATVTKKKPPALSRGKKRSVQISSDEEFEEEGEEEDDEDDDDEAMYVEAKSPPVTRRRKRRSGKNDVDDDDKDEVRIVETKKPRREPDNRPETIHKPEPMPVFEAKKEVQTVEQLWVDKYRPVNMNDLCANPKHVTDLINWLRNWQKVHLGHGYGGKGKKVGGEPEKAVLLSGPPGVGKTTLAHVACRQLGMEAHEFNASDTRNKGAIHDIVGSLALNEAIGKYCRISVGPRQPVTSNGQVLIMDEVDGMSAGDRGGMQELIQVIKRSKVPIICIANDDSNTKVRSGEGREQVRSLANYCLKMKFRRPMASQVRKRLQYICEQEGYKSVPVEVVESIANSCNGDIRQMINLLQGWRSSGRSLTQGDVTTNLLSEGKTFQTQSIFELFKVFFERNLSVSARLDKYFMDADLVPLMIQENYLHFQGSDDLGKMADAADSISESDLGNRLLREEMRWDLMPPVALMSTVRPGSIINSHLFGRPSFPSWLGKMSSERKYIRIAQEIDMRMKTRLSTGWKQLVLDYAPCLRDELSKPLLDRGVDGIDDVIDVLDEYYLSRDDWEAILDLASVKNKSNPKDELPTKVKSTFTKSYESREHHSSTVSAVKVKKSSGDGGGEGGGTVDTDVIVEKDEVEAADDGNGEGENDKEEDVGKDNLVKVGRGTGAKRGGRGGKAANGGRGRGKKK